jgi:hypothetical protein
MKTRFISLFLSVFVIFLLLPKSGFSQRASAKNNDIAGDFVGYLMPENTFTVQYEWKGTTTQSWVVRGELLFPGTNTSAFGVGGQMRFYILDSRALAGFSVGPAVDVLFFKNNDLGKNIIAFSIGGDIAHKWFFDSFTVEPSFGARFGITGKEVWTSINKYSGIYVVGNVYFGWSW